MSSQDDQWVAFRCSLLGPVILGEVPPSQRERYFQQLSREERRLPNGNVKCISVRTFRRLWRRFEAEGVSGLYRRARTDKGKPRRKHAELLDRALELKKQRASRSAEEINRILNLEFGCQIPRSTLYHHLRREGATRRKRRPSSMKVRCPVRPIPPCDERVLEQWRESGDKRLWEKAVTILDCQVSTFDELAVKIERSVRTIRRWIRLYNQHGIDALRRKKRDRSKSSYEQDVKKRRVLEILHDRPASFGLRRSNWNLNSLAIAYEKRYGEAIGKSTIGQLIRNAGHRFRKARRVLTSPDPNYREKVELLLETLQSLKPSELLFFVDELGPLRVRAYGGRCYAPRGKPPTYVDRPTSKGSVTLFGALSATTNQVTWFYGKSKDTLAMIDLAEILFNQHHDKTRLYITWDAASWHRSNALTSWLDAFNGQTREIGGGPIFEFVPLPSRSQFLDVIESVFSGMKRAVIHHSDYASEQEMKSAISTHFVDRNEYFKDNPRRAGKKIWEIDFFNDFRNLRGGDYREW